MKYFIAIIFLVCLSGVMAYIGQYLEYTDRIKTRPGWVTYGFVWGMIIQFILSEIMKG